MIDFGLRVNHDLATLAQNIRSSLVHINNGREGSGTGAIWHADGLILTNAHVVRDESVSVTLPDGRRLPASVLAYDEKLDLAALHVQAGALPTIEIGDSRNLKAGQWVMAMGNPYGITGAVTAGIIIGIENNLPERPGDGRPWIILSLKLRPGYSGGPLVDVTGRLIGINTAISGASVGMAVPVHVVKEFLKEEVHKELVL